jgi:hypothetical protein
MNDEKGAEMLERGIPDSLDSHLMLAVKLSPQSLPRTMLKNSSSED